MFLWERNKATADTLAGTAGGAGAGGAGDSGKVDLLSEVEFKKRYFGGFFSSASASASSD
jgi:hypothetical protein